MLSPPGRRPSRNRPHGRDHEFPASRVDEECVIDRSATGIKVGTQSAPVVRKKLPWLDGGQQSKPARLPGAFESKQSLWSAPRQADEIAAPSVPALQVIVKGRTSLTSLDGDPSLRAVGSTPALRGTPKAVEVPRTLSLNSEPRPGVKPVLTKQEIRRALGVLSEQTVRADDYTPSEYSTTISSDPELAQPPPARRKGTRRERASYESAVQRAVARKSTSGSPLHFAQEWLQDELDAPVKQSSTSALPDNPTTGKSGRHGRAAFRQAVRQASTPKPDRPEPLTVPEVAPASQKRKCKDSGSCRSCDSPVLGSSRDISPAKPSDVFVNPVRAQSAPMQHQQVRAGTTMPKPPPRKDTLYGFPAHLMASSSSSTDVPSHLQMTSTDMTPQSPNVSPHSTIRVSKPTTDNLLVRPPAPARTRSSQLRRDTLNLNRAVTSFEDLVEEALVIAVNAAHRGNEDEVAKILEGATEALRRAGTVVPKREKRPSGRMSRPLRLSTAHESGPSSDTDSAYDLARVSEGYGSTPHHSRAVSTETAPTLLTKSAQSSQHPLVVDRYKQDGKTPVSQRATVEQASDDSMSKTPPRLYQPPSVDSIVRDFAYAKIRNARARSLTLLNDTAGYGEAADFYGDHGESVATQPGVRRSIALEKITDLNKPLPQRPPPDVPEPRKNAWGRHKRRPGTERSRDMRRFTESDLTKLEHAPTNTEPTRSVDPVDDTAPSARPPTHKRDGYRRHLADFFETSYYRHPEKDHNADVPQREVSGVTDTRSVPPPTAPSRSGTKQDPPRNHLSLKEGQGFSLGRYHRRQPIAREWHTVRKRITAAIACANTVFIGLIAGIYAGEVPRIQYQIADTTHKVILGNVLLFAGLGLTTLIFWPLPLLHGRKPYTLLAFALMLPLQFPQALAISAYRDPSSSLYRCGLLIPRVLTGLAMGFANINQLPTLFDLFGCSLMSEFPHQEIVTTDDVRRQGGGVGIWLGIWSFCFVGSLSIGFCIGACIISALDPSWGFYMVVILLAFFLLVNVIAPETRRAPYRRSIAHFFDDKETLKRRVARGEVKLHISNDGPRWWFEEVWAGIILTKRMVFQPGFFVLMSYIAWIYAQVTLVILLLGALLSRNYNWQPQFVGAASLSLAIGALLAMPLAKASVFSRSRFTPQRTDSMTMHAPRLTWTSHLIRRCAFTLLLPFAGLAYTLSAPGPPVNWSAPTIFCGLVGFLSNLAIAECVGLIMETFDTCDLQPGVNQKHRQESMLESTRRRRTNYSSFPRVCAGFFAAQSLGFFLAAAATGVSGDITRALGAQISVAVVAGILLVVTTLFTIVMWRWKEVQVIPTSVFNTATKKGSVA